MSLPSYFKGRALVRVLGGITVAGTSIYILNRNRQSSQISLMPAQAPAKTAFRAAGPSFLRLKLQSSENVSPTTKRLRFELPSPDAISGLGLCSAVLTAAWPKGSYFPVIRPYTPVGRLDEKGFLELTVKHYPGGKMSSHLHSLNPGDTLLFPAVIPAYSWVPNKHEHVTLIAGGAGVTPIFQLAQGILNNPHDKTRVSVIYGVRNDAEILFRDQFARWQQEFPDRFSATFVVGDPEPGSSFGKAVINDDTLSKLMPRPSENEKVFVCGPPGMETALVGSKSECGILQQLGYNKAQVFKF